MYLFIYYCFCLTTTFARKFLSQKLSASRSLTSSLCAQNAALASSLSLSCFFFFLRLFISFSPSFFFFFVVLLLLYVLVWIVTLFSVVSVT